MKMDKLEPHITEPAKDDRDVDSFVEEIHNKANNETTETSSNTSASDPPVQKEQEEVKNGFVRLTDFLAKQQQKAQTRRSINPIGHQTHSYKAQEAYAKQIYSMHPNETIAINLKTKV